MRSQTASTWSRHVRPGKSTPCSRSTPRFLPSTCWMKVVPDHRPNVEHAALRHGSPPCQSLLVLWPAQLLSGLLHQAARPLAAAHFPIGVHPDHRLAARLSGRTALELLVAAFELHVCAFSPGAGR